MCNKPDLEKICGNCQLFHSDTSAGGLEAGQNAVIVTRQTLSNIPINVYGKKGCLNDTVGTISGIKCTEPIQFQPLQNLTSTT
jgi:hypothetical protein